MGEQSKELAKRIQRFQNISRTVFLTVFYLPFMILYVLALSQVLKGAGPLEALGVAVAALVSVVGVLYAIHLVWSYWHVLLIRMFYHDLPSRFAAHLIPKYYSRGATDRFYSGKNNRFREFSRRLTIRAINRFYVTNVLSG